MMMCGLHEVCAFAVFTQNVPLNGSYKRSTRLCMCMRASVRACICAYVHVCMCMYYAQSCNKASSDLDPGCMNKELLHTWYGSKSPGTGQSHLVRVKVTLYGSKSPGTSQKHLVQIVSCYYTRTNTLYISISRSLYSSNQGTYV